MNIAVIGATGMAGSRIAAEAIRRGHTVSGVTRSEQVNGQMRGGISFFTADATDSEVMSRIAAQHHVIVLATRPDPGSENQVHSPLLTVLDAASEFERRVVVIGGAGPLKCPDSDRMVIDDQRFVPQEWRAIAQASVDQFNACTGHPADWVYLSPPAIFGPGIRTGTYRRGGDRILIDNQGESRISAEDFAIAAMDEIETPEPGLRHFTVGY